MRKNDSFFNKVAGFVLAMVLAVGFTSCEDILGEWDKPSAQVQEVINTIVTVTGADPSAVTAALKAVVTDEAVAAAAAKGEPIKVTVAGSGVSTDATDQTITIPQKNGAAIEINFATVPSGTDSNALVLQASEGAGEIPGAANNNLVVTMPPSEGLAITIELPETTVTLKTDGTGAVVYKDVIAKTAKSTIIIDKDVTIKEHEMVGGNIVVKDGGAIETIALTVKDNFGFVSLGSWWSKIGFMETGLVEYYITKEDGSPYIPKNLRIKKGGGDYISVETRCRADEYVERVTVDEGITIAYMGGDMTGQYKNIVGKGNTRLHTRSGISQQNEYFLEFSQNTELVSNFTIANEIHDVEELYTGVANLVVVFNGDQTGSNIFTFENCNFENSNTQFVLNVRKYKAVMHYVAFQEGVDPAAPDAYQHVYNSTNLQELLDAGVPNKEVKAKELGGYWKDEQLEDDGASLVNSDLTLTLVFKNCKIGGAPITKDNVKFPKWGLWTPQGANNIKYQVIIDDVTYKAVTRWYAQIDERNGTIELELPHD